ncbi:DUF1203 domain-containing protein [Chelativorans salis]|uniref:DUF1203 domain-containing protein n=1 Tax=Chelativorans salis TaxID=2978478 RepID=A0ABT2LL37_9HYPH|nr:DUF1203 domain-containing protein [Chelativorans sp. EGI FJ00035]MCT7375307.1 DUF1203 domain-containing protein [Chelativorans sp. EGI FJ00035]
MGLIRFIAMPTREARAFQGGGLDAYGSPPERRISDGDGVPCRHCLRHVPAGRPYLVFAYRPFPDLQPYAETGPIFLCADECPRAMESDVMPETLRASTEFLLRGYDGKDRIIYGTGSVTPKRLVCTQAHELLQRPQVVYLHLRSAKYNCYQCRIERA